MSFSDAKANTIARPTDGVDNPPARTAELFHFLGPDWEENTHLIVARTLAVIGGLFSVYIETGSAGGNGRAIVRSGSGLPQGFEQDLSSHDTCFTRIPEDEEIILMETDREEFLDDPVAEKYGLTTLLGAVVRGDGKPSGILWVADTRRERTFSSGRIHALHCFSGALAFQTTLRQHNEIRKIGEMASQAAHDLNNILTGLVSYPELVLMQLDKNSPLNAPISFMHESGAMASEMVQDFLLLARPQSYKPPRLDPARVLRSYFSSTTHARLIQAYPHVRFSFGTEQDMENIRISEILLTKLVTTLLGHAASKMRKSSRVDVMLSNAHTLDCRDTIAPEYRENHLLLSIKDNGDPIEDKDIECLFDPFYVKKQMGYPGSGLGLAVVRKIMTDHDGFATVRNRKTKGLAFHLFFPAAGPADV
ncbi:MAG: HAMP domain-containing sensor histidine kinase [Desulfobacter sp.]